LPKGGKIPLFGKEGIGEIFKRYVFSIMDSLVKRENPTLDNYRRSWKDKDSAERNLQKVIEAIIDLGKMLIADKKLREPSNNREVFQILEEEGLFPSELMPLIDKMIGMRNVLVHTYNRIDDSIIYGVLKKNLLDIKKLSLVLKKTCLRKNKNI
jgi:uncharacterized protein YutE (UPF0331/DUF86 family)